MSRKIPKKLGKDTIVEAIWEIRFSGGHALAEILPGVVYQKLVTSSSSAIPKVEKLPQSQIPQEILEKEPSLRYAPQVTLVTDSYAIQIGNHMASVSFPRPYPGWESFKDRILWIAKILEETEMLGQIERFSLKYTDIIPGAVVDSLDGLDVSLEMGGISLVEKKTHVRTEIPENEFLHIVQIGRPVKVDLLSTGDVVEGVLVDIDTICVSSGADFWGGIPSGLVSAHEASKRLFFTLLKPETEELLEPEY